MNIMKATLLKEIREAEEEGKEQAANDIWRMHYHLMPPVGWLNDPNGLCQYKGMYYVFFQYSPLNPKGGLKVWGEYRSKDMVYWDYVGTPLLADSPYDCHGVYSGSAFIDDGLMEIFYTGNIKYDGDYDYTNNGREANTVYTSSRDGITFSQKECLLVMKDYPKGYTNHIRDPKVWEQDGIYYMVLGGRKVNHQGAVLLYTSSDKKKWTFLKEITTSSPFGYMWECPDLFCIGGKEILSISPQGLEAEEFRFQNIHQSGYFVLNSHFREESDLQEFREWDMGFDFYAPQTFRDEKGRRILIGWAGLPDTEVEYQNPTVEYGWQHALTVPRELTLKDDKILQYPIPELEMLRAKEIKIQSGQETALNTSCFDWVMNGLDSKEWNIIIEKQCIIQYKDNILSLAFTGELGRGRRIRRIIVKELSNIRILADCSILELYINSGEYVLTTRFYPESESVSVLFEGKAEKSIVYFMN